MRIRTTAAAQCLLYGFALAFQITAHAQPLRLVSARDASQPLPAGGNGDSLTPIISPDGRYVLFASAANNLLLNSNHNPIATGLVPAFNVFLRDRTNGATSLVSINLAGDGGGNGDSSPAALSPDGRYALFESAAGNLAAGATNGLAQIFVRDLQAQATLLVSVDTNGLAANAGCRGSTMTPDGRFVAFVSAASRLVNGDTNGIPDVFVRDMQNGVTTLASVGAKATNANTIFIGSEAPVMSDDGRYVAFFSIATNLVPGVRSGGEIYVRDTIAQTTAWVSGGARPLLGISNVVSFNQAISAASAYIAFETATNLPMGSTNNGIILRYNLKNGVTDLVARNAYVQNANPDEIRSLTISPDGRFIAFVANTNSSTCVLLWDAQAGASTLVSSDVGGQVPTNSICEWPSIDPSGRFVAFLSNGTNLVANSLTSSYNLYVRDTQAATTVLANATTNADGAPITLVAEPRLAAGGAILAFESPDAPLVSNDSNHAFDVFMRDLAGGTTELVSTREPTLGSATPLGLSAPSIFSASPDGRFLVFTSTADDLAPGHNSGMRDVFVRDLLMETTVLASIGTNATGADGISSEPAISGDGRYVAFTSAADNLVAGDTNRVQDVFVRDLQTGTTALISINDGGTASGNGLSHAPAISTDGRFVLFRSKATNLSTNSVPAGYDNFCLRDLQLGLTYVLTAQGGSASMTASGRWVAFTDTTFASSGKIYIWDSMAASVAQTNLVPSGVGQLALSPQGDRVAFFAGPVPSLYILDRLIPTTNLVANGYPVGSWTGPKFSSNGGYLAYALAPTNFGPSQVYLYDYQNRSNGLVSHMLGSNAAAVGTSDTPDISADGRFVAYRSFATNLLARPTSSNFPSVFLYDRQADASTLLSGSTGSLPDNRSSKPIFAADGRNLFFGSYASGLVPLDFNHSQDVFALGFLYATIAPASFPGLGPTLIWPARPGETYHVQFKSNLSDTTWQNVIGTVVVTGNQASLTDLAPAPGQRFYRVAAY